MLIISNRRGANGDLLCPTCERPIKDDLARKPFSVTGEPQGPADPQVITDDAGSRITFVHTQCPIDPSVFAEEDVQYAEWASVQQDRLTKDITGQVASKHPEICTHPQANAQGCPTCLTEF